MQASRVKSWQIGVLVAYVLGGVVAGLLAVRQRRHHRVAAPARPVERAEIAGRVIDRQGRPVVGALVRVQAEAPSNHGAPTKVGGAEGPLSSETRADGNGAFRLAAARGEARLTVEAAGFQTLELRHLRAPAEGLEVALARTLGLEGVVRAAGRPAPETLVEIAGPGGRKETHAGPDGAFSFPSLPEGTYALRAGRDDEAAYLEQVQVAGGARSGVLAVELKPAARVEGRVRDGAGQPVVTATVTLVEAPFGPLGRTAHTGLDGAFAFRGVAPGAYLLSARADGHYGGAARPVEVGKSGVTRAELTLLRGAVIEGLVVDERGRPVAGASLEVAGEALDGAPIAVTAAQATVADPAGRLEASGELGILRGPIPFPPAAPLPLTPSTVGTATAGGFISDKRGAFRLSGLPPGRLVVTAAHPAYARAASEPLEARPGATLSTRITLRSGQSVRGRVVDDRGAPVPGAELAADGNVLTVSDAKGEFTLEHVTGPLSLEARAPGYVTARRTVAPDESAPIELQLAHAEGRLAGVVVDDRGTPLSGARVEAQAATAPPKTTVTDRAGAFRLDGLAAGPYRVIVRHSDYAPLVSDGVSPGDDARLQLTVGAGLEGEVRDARTGGVPAGCRVELELAGERRPLALKSGRFEATGLQPGAGLLRASAPGYVAVARTVELPAGERPREITLREITVELQRGGAVFGEVRDDRGDPVAGAGVTAAGQVVRTDARGEYRLEGLPAGTVQVRAESAGRRAVEEAGLRADEDTRIDLRLP